jgi:integrase
VNRTTEVSSVDGSATRPGCRNGRRLDDSALRRRYYRGCEVAGLRRVKLHGLRHAAGSILARVADPVFVRDYLGHSKLSTTDRYVSAKHRPEDFERLNRAFGAQSRKCWARRRNVRHARTLMYGEPVQLPRSRFSSSPDRSP